MTNWKVFFQKYRLIEIRDAQDLLYQVAKTVAGKPISPERFNRVVESIISCLELGKGDCLIDLCCGNGVITYELSKYVEKIMGIDFSKPYIENAIRYRQLPNITYILKDVTELADTETGQNIKEYNKVLMYEGLAYLTPAGFDKILAYLKSAGSVEKFFVGGVPDSEKRWKFFNSAKRRLIYLWKCEILGKDFGMGHWWTKKEITNIGKRYGFVCTYLQQDRSLPTAHYRFDVLMTNAP